MGLLSHKVREWNWWCVKQTQSKMHKKCLETKTSSNNAKPTTFQKDSFSFLFNFHKISCSNPTEFSLRSASYLYFELYWKNLCKKTSFRATDATTKSSNQEDNEKKRKFFIYLLQNNATRKNDDKMKTKRMKRKLWLKAQIANRIRAQKCWKAIKTTPIRTLA